MAANTSPAKRRRQLLAAPAWWYGRSILALGCAKCGARGRQPLGPVDGLTLQQVVGRMRCPECKAPPWDVVLVSPEGHEVPLQGTGARD